MPKDPTYPVLYDRVLQISITDLKKLELLKPDSLMFNVLSWKNQNLYVSVWLNTQSLKPCIELHYAYQQRTINYTIDLLAIPSNLGIGKVWLFVCPVTGKRCRKLYFAKGMFLHRDAFKNGMYYKQAQDKVYCSFDKLFGYHWKIETLERKMSSKHFKTHYAGKPTKRYLRLLEQVKKYEAKVGI